MPEHYFFIWYITFLVLLFVLPVVLMLVLYPVIIVTLLRLKVPGNSSSLSQVIRLRKRNIHLTKMFISIIVPLLVTNGTFQLAFVIRRFSLLSTTS